MRTIIVSIAAALFVAAAASAQAGPPRRGFQGGWGRGGPEFRQTQSARQDRAVAPARGGGGGGGQQLRLRDGSCGTCPRGQADRPFGRGNGWGRRGAR